MGKVYIPVNTTFAELQAKSCCMSCKKRIAERISSTDRDGYFKCPAQSSMLSSRWNYSEVCNNYEKAKSSRDISDLKVLFEKCYKMGNNNKTPNFGRGYYVATAIFTTLNISLKDENYTTIKSFQDTYLENNEQYSGLLQDYDLFGPIIASEIIASNDKERLASIAYSEFILPVAALIKSQKYDEAIQLYGDMIKHLKELFQIQSLPQISDSANVNSTVRL